jgi:biopolymer transport protein ExbD
MDFVAFANLALIAVFFLFFGSRFVLSPALRIAGKDFDLPAMKGASRSLLPSTAVVSVISNGQIFADTGLITSDQLKAWLKEKAARTPSSRLLVRADKTVSMEVVTGVMSAAMEAGFADVSYALNEPAAAP